MIEKAKKLLKQYYGYEEFRKGQEQIIASILGGKDTFGIMPTGGGKSICFQIPALLFPGVTLVISPLISLMKDQTESLEQLGILATYINSSLDYWDVRDRIEDCRNGKFKLIYIAPERLESEEFISLVQSLSIDFLAIDEAHCVSQWGHDFRPSYKWIASFIEGLKDRPIVAAFTATATEEVKNDVVRLLKLRFPNEFVTGFDRENLYFSVQKGIDRKDFLLRYVEEHRNEVGIIYAATRKEVDKLSKILHEHGVSVTKYHAGMNDLQRTKAQEAFIFDNVNVIVATNAFGMGIDKSNVRYVVHYNMPRNIEAYYQEAGRAGRDGEPSECILLFSPQDILLQRYMIQNNNLSPERSQYEYKRLQFMVDYCHTTNCLRKYILEYFGEEEVEDKCFNCSTCTDESELIDITLDAQKIFSCVYRMKERYGITLISEVLKGSNTKKVRKLGMDKLSTYGIMKEYTLNGIKDVINILIADGYMALTEDEYPVVKLQAKAIDVLKNKEEVWRRIHHKVKEVKIDHTLFEQLRSLRKEISSREQVPPYVIFHDSTLREMSEQYPTDFAALGRIKGVGQAKLEKYGEEFIKIIQNYVIENNIVFTGKNDEENTIASKQSNIASHIITYNMYNKGMSISEIVKERGLKVITIQEHLLRCYSEGMEINLNDFIPLEYEELIANTIKKIGGEKLKPIKEALPDGIDYMAIKATLFKHKI